MRELIGERPDVAFSCGIHPLNLDEPYDFTQLRELAADKRVVALGETGWITTIRKRMPRFSVMFSASISVSAVS